MLASKTGRRSSLFLRLDARRMPGSFSVCARRWFSVKELSWCAPKGSPTRRPARYRGSEDKDDRSDGICVSGPTEAATKANQTLRDPRERTPPSSKALPIGAFGIVAAVCRPAYGTERTNSSGIIGVNGRLPWGSLPRDRALFERLTRNRILVVGRRTLLDERDGALDHVRHAKHCIVVSGSISCTESDPRIARHREEHGLGVEVAGSLDEALCIARTLAAKDDEERRGGTDDPGGRGAPTFRASDGNGKGEEPIEPPMGVSLSTDSIPCWVAGGERLYEEALKHGSALELHLSVVDFEVDLTAPAVKKVARFPAKYRWDHNYEAVAETLFPPNHGDAGQESAKEPGFAYRVYNRILRKKP